MISIYVTKKASRYRLYLEGHADYAPTNDIVCAAVSALTEALIGYAAESPACHHLRFSIKKGEAFLSCRGGLGAGFDMILRAYQNIARLYPNHVRIEYVECS